MTFGTYSRPSGADISFAGCLLLFVSGTVATRDMHSGRGTKVIVICPT
jgi:hypothetical protein